MQGYGFISFIKVANIFVPVKKPVPLIVTVFVPSCLSFKAYGITDSTVKFSILRDTLSPTAALKLSTYTSKV
jgi:hypothetical protein